MIFAGDFGKNIFTPHHYHIELLTCALQRNTIVASNETNCKSFIAVSLIKEFALKLLLPWADGGKRVFFIVNRAELVERYAALVECHTNFKVARVEGQQSWISLATASDLQEIFATHEVFVATGDAFLEMCNRRDVTLDDVALLIFDECHHALNSKHHYAQILRICSQFDSDDRPRILGITSSFATNSVNPNILESLVARLEDVLCSTVASACDLPSAHLSNYDLKPVEVIVEYAISSSSKAHGLCKLIYDSLADVYTQLQKCSEFGFDYSTDHKKTVPEAFCRSLFVFSQLGPWCALKVLQLFQRRLKQYCNQYSVSSESPPHSPSLQFNYYFLKMAETEMRFASKRLNKLVGLISTFDQLTRFITPKVARLLELLQSLNPKFHSNYAFSGVIYVDQRYAAFALNNIVKFVAKIDSENFGYLSSDFMIGYSNKSVGWDEKLIAHRRQEEVLRRFRTKSINLLIVTNILEEGIELRQCNVVIRFDRPRNYRSYIQSRSRAHLDNSHYFFLIEESNKKSLNADIHNFKKIESILLRRKQTDSEATDGANAIHTERRIYKSYTVASTGAKVTLDTAISVVNRYCAKLPSDIFTKLVPHCRLISIEVHGIAMYDAELLLPMNSPVNEVIKTREPMLTKRLAQMSVALEACKILHLRKELSDNLLPVDKDVYTLAALEDDPDEYIPNVSGQVGSARRKQLYDKRMAKALNNALPSANSACKMYIIEMDLQKVATYAMNPRKRKITNPLDENFCYGFLSKKLIPNIPAFPMYLRQGRVLTNIRLYDSDHYVSEENLSLLKEFHHYIFDGMLRLVKGGFDFVPEEAPINILLVPLRRVRDAAQNEARLVLDYTYIKNILSSTNDLPRIPSDDERRNFKFDPDKFKDSVVTPWYRDINQQTFYYVAEILNLTPTASFPDSKFASFIEYFIQKYSITIYDESQRLLDVDYISSRLNLLMPKLVPRAKIRQIHERPEIGGQILVPELLNVHPIPASLWKLSAALPTVLYRMNSLLLADELRMTVLRDALIPHRDVPSEFTWLPLDYMTVLNDEDAKPVTKIDVLTKENQLVERQNDAMNANNNAQNDQGYFEIGVWDPELARGLVLNPMRDVDGTGTSVDDQDADTVGLLSGGAMLNQHGDISDTEEEAIVLFDFRNIVKEKLQTKAMDDVFSPRDDIQAEGWDHPSVLAQDNEIYPLTVSCNSTLIDSRALMDDLNSMNWIQNNNNNSNIAANETLSSGKNVVKKSEEFAELISTDTEVKLVESKSTQPALSDKSNLSDTLVSSTTAIHFGGTHPSDDIDSFVVKDDAVDLRHFYDGGLEINSDAPILSESPDLKFIRVNDPVLLALNENIFAENEDAHDADNDHEQEDLNQNHVNEPSNYAHPAENGIWVEPTGVGFSNLPADVDHSDQIYGVSPSVLLQALTLSSAGDGISLERLETIGDSFLKFAVTDHLYTLNQDQHEGKLSFVRSKEVSNCNLYRLGKKRNLPSLITGMKFDPSDQWLPPCYAPVSNCKAPNLDDAEERDLLMDAVLQGSIPYEDTQKKTQTGWDEQEEDGAELRKVAHGIETIHIPKAKRGNYDTDDGLYPISYNQLCQQCLSDKSIADCVEALIGAHLIELGISSTLKFMKWLGLKVSTEPRMVSSPLLRNSDNNNSKLSYRKLDEFWTKFQFSKLERIIDYKFNNPAYLLQAFTHASYYENRITGCYQRLEFLGDAVLDYIITHYLYNHPRCFGPGVLTDLRSALVNNTIFASLAVEHNFHKYFVAICPGLQVMIDKFAKLCEEKKFKQTNFNAEMYMITTEDEIDEGEEEDVEVPKAMGDVFESLAGAVYLDSGKNLDTVWRVFYKLMKKTIEECCKNPPKSPVRELLELEREGIRFSKLERILSTGKTRVTVEVQGKCHFTGMGRNYRIAKITAAKRALQYLKSLKLEKNKQAQ